MNRDELEAVIRDGKTGLLLWPAVRTALDEYTREVKAAALREWINEWPTTPDDGTFLADVAREGRERADRIARGATR